MEKSSGRWPRLAHTQRGHTLVMLLLIPLYAICFVAIRIGLQYAPPLRFAALRLLVAALSLLFVAGIFHQPLCIGRRFWPGLLALALTAGAFGYGAMFLSPGQTGAGIASVLGNTQPLILVALAAWLLGERVTRQKLITLVLGLAGVFVLSLAALSALRLAGLVGAIFAFASAVSFAVATVLMKRLGTAAPLLAITAWQFILGATPLFALSSLLEGATPIRWTSAFVGIVLLLGVGGTAITTTTWYWLAQRDDVGRLSLYLFLVPVVGVILSMALLGERLSLFTGIGVVLTLVAVAVTLLHDAPGSAPHAAPAAPGAPAARAAPSSPAPPPADSPSSDPPQRTTTARQ